MHRARFTIVTLGFVTALGLSACGSSAVQGGGGLTTKPPTTTAPAGAGATAGSAASATIAGYAFQITGSPTAGTPLTVTNNDSVTHTFTVVCRIHASMKASITVG